MKSAFTYLRTTTLVLSAIFICNWAKGQTNNGSTSNSAQLRTTWKADPFDHNLFIENRGQFDTDLTDNSKILYMVRLGNVRAYFTTNGVTYRYDEVPDFMKTGQANQADREEQDREIEAFIPKSHFLTTTWENANPNVTVNTDEQQSYPYIYPTGLSGSMSVSVFKKIKYANIYPGIDVEYSFPKGKTGLEYALVIHPGADLSKVKLKYTGATSGLINSAGDLVVSSEIGELTDHAPVSYYLNGGHINSICKFGNMEESFAFTQNYDKSQTVVIDPWVSNPTFIVANGGDRAYDVDYDNAGNVYAYGSAVTCQLTKFNSVGTLLYTFNDPATINGYAYGDFAVDKVSGTIYICSGLFLGSPGPGAAIIKVNTNGVLLATYGGVINAKEIWRITFNAPTRKFILGLGDPSAGYAQWAMLDTTFAGMAPVNTLNALTGGNDNALLAFDPTGTKVYAAFNGGPSFTYTYCALFSAPVPALTPAGFTVNSGYGFTEIGAVNYVSGGFSNAMNGMAASYNWLYTYDGANLKRWNKATGALVSTVAVTGTPYTWGGLDVDSCDNIYVGENSSIKVYNSALTLTNTFALSNTVYDVVLGKKNQVVYSCGIGFVQSTNTGSTCFTALPVQLQKFDCKPGTSDIELDWSTATETNNKFFSILRSQDGINFQTIATIPGAGNSSVAQYYTYTDKSPYPGVNYYRLGQTDFDGNTQWFDVISCNAEGSSSLGTVYPNPSAGNFTVSIDNTVSEIEIYNAIGQKIYDKQLGQLSTQTTTYSIDLSGQPTGIYVMKVIQSDFNTVVKKIIVAPR